MSVFFYNVQKQHKLKNNVKIMVEIFEINLFIDYFFRKYFSI